MALAQSHNLGSLCDGKLVFQNAVEHLDPGLFLLIQCQIPHGVTFFADQLVGDIIVEQQQVAGAFFGPVALLAIGFMPRMSEEYAERRFRDQNERDRQEIDKIAERRTTGVKVEERKEPSPWVWVSVALLAVLVFVALVGQCWRNPTIGT